MRRGPFYGWIVVAGGFIVLFIAYGTQYAFGVFFGALLAEFGWSRASLSGVFSVYTVVYSGLALAAGRLTDRWGPRIVIALGGVRSLRGDRRTLVRATARPRPRHHVERDQRRRLSLAAHRSLPRESSRL